MSNYQLLRDLADGRIVLGGSFVPTKDEMIEFTVETIEDCYREVLDIPDVLQRKRGAVEFLNCITKIGGLGGGRSATVPFDPDGIAWLNQVINDMGRVIFDFYAVRAVVPRSK